MPNRKKKSLAMFHSAFNKNKGDMTLTLLLGVVIIGAITLASGIFPKSEITPRDPNQPEAVPIDITGTVQKNSLELRSLQFQTCSAASAIAFLVDVSGSMSFGNKIGNLKAALTTFSSKLTDDSVIGLYSFSDNPQEKLPFSYYKDVKSTFPSVVNTLQPLQATYTRKAFTFIKPKIEAATQTFPGYKFTLVFISDGIPESYEYVNYCRVTDTSFGPNAPADCSFNCKLPTAPGEKTRCFAPDQDPTASPDITQQLKDEGVQIYSIAILDQKDSRFNTQLQTLLKNVASPDDFFVSPTGQDLTDIVNKIGIKMCSNLN